MAPMVRPIACFIVELKTLVSKKLKKLRRVQDFYWKGRQPLFFNWGRGENLER